MLLLELSDKARCLADPPDHKLVPKNRLLVALEAGKPVCAAPHPLMLCDRFLVEPMGSSSVFASREVDP